MRGLEAIRGLLRSTPLRLTIAISILFLFVGAVSFMATWLYILRTSENALLEGLEQEISTLAALPNREVLKSTLNLQAQRTSPEYRLLSYRTPDGEVAGHLRLPPMTPGLQRMRINSDRDQYELRDHDNEPVKGFFLALTREVHGGSLTLAVDAGELDDTGEALLAVSLFSLIPTALIAIGSGLFIAIRSRSHIDRIESTLGELSTGRLEARVDASQWRQQDLQRIGMRVDRMAEAQQEQMAALKQVSADIAHDLKTPIQRVSVMLSQLDQDDSLSDDARDLLERATSETDNIVQTFQSLLLLAQLEGGSTRSRFETVDLSALATAFHELYEASASDSAHQLNLELPLEPVSIQGEKNLLGQLLANLIENALRHTPPNTTITISLRRSDDSSVLLDVADNGPGIPETERENALKRLYRLERSRTTPGNGLGLSIATAIAQLHGGSLQLKDNHPGLLVSIILPS